MQSKRRVFQPLITIALLTALGVPHLQAIAQQTTKAPEQSKPVGDKPIEHNLPPDVPGHTEFLDYKNGFRNKTFGTGIADFKNLELYRQRGPVKAYEMSGDSLVIGNAKAISILYIFINDKFFAVSIHADTHNGSNLLKLFQTGFGPGVHSQENTTSQYFWTGRVASAHLFEDVGPDHEVRGWIGNNDLQKEYDKITAQFYIDAAQQL